MSFRACFVYSAANLAKESFFVKEEKRQQLADICHNFLSLPDVSLTKLMAALVTARTQTNQVCLPFEDECLLELKLKRRFLGLCWHTSYLGWLFVALWRVRENIRVSFQILCRLVPRWLTACIISTTPLGNVMDLSYAIRTYKVPALAYDHCLSFLCS